MRELTAERRNLSGRPARSRFSEILIVEPEAILREILISGLRLHDASFAPRGVETPEQALALLAEQDVDLVITETAFDERRREQPPADRRAIVYLRRLRELAPHAPLLLVTEDAAEVVRLGAPFDALIGKPPDMDELLGRVDQLLRRSRESVIRGMALETLLQMLQLERASCTLGVSVRGRTGQLHLLEGELVHAEAGVMAGRDALFELMSWPSPILALGDGREVERTIRQGVSALLLEYYVNEDNRRR